MPSTDYFRAVRNLVGIVLACSGFVLMYFAIVPQENTALVWAVGIVFIVSIFAILWFSSTPEQVRAHNTDTMLTLASDTLELMRGGLNYESAQRICELLLPHISGVAVAITGTVHILGYAGVSEDGNPSGKLIRTQATKDTIADGKTRVMKSAEEIGFSTEVRGIKAAIIMPLKVSGKVEGTLKFYYDSPRRVTKTQQSIAEGFADILSTQLAVSALEEQKKLATSMELRALQLQINPHFLFNTLNTIAAFIRMDPNKARVLLREFATFYRKTLEDTGDLLALSKEVEQVQRYFMFEQARFGEDRVALEIDVPEELNEVLIPSFMIQPIVENSVRHGRPMDGKLTVTVSARAEGDDLYITIKDDGVGMTEEQRRNILNAKSDSGLGIAVKNINSRVTGYFGPESTMTYYGAEGKGTTVVLFLKDGVVKDHSASLRKDGNDGSKIPVPNPAPVQPKIDE